MSAAPRFFSRALTAPLIVFATGVLTTFVVASELRQSEQALANGNFARLAARIEIEVTQRFLKPLYGLRGAAGSLEFAKEAGVTLGRAPFRAYVESRDLPTEFPGIRGFGLIERVDRSGIDRFLAKERADGAPDFSIRQLASQDHDEWYVIKYIEPVARNAAALGIDVGSEPRRREAIERAIDRAQPTITAPISLAQDGGRTPGFLIFLPLYRTPTALKAPELRRSSLSGVLYAPVIARELLVGAADVAEGQVDFELFAGAPTTGGAERVFHSGTGPEDGALAVGTPEPQGRALETTRALVLFGSPFTLRIRTTPQFAALQEHHTPALALAGGLLLSGILAWLSYLTAAGRARAESLAASMTADLDRLAVVARRTSNAVVITDLARRITWVNAGFERLTGHAFAEALGQSPGALLRHPDADPDSGRRLSEALNAGKPFHGEVLNRAKDGRAYWIDLEIQPIKDAHEVTTGFMAIETDITDKKNVERELSRQRQRLSNIIDGTQVGTWEWNVETGATVFNERWAQILGRTLAELGQTTITTWSDLTHPEDLSRSSVLLDRHFNGETSVYECEARLRHKDGRWVWVLARGQLFSRSADGRPRWLAGTFTDINERKLAEAALRSSEAFLDRTGRIGGVGGWQMDLSTHQLRWTDQTCRIHEVSLGHQPTLDEAVAYYAPEARPVFAAAVQRSIDAGDGFDLELAMVTAQGRPIWVRAVGEIEYADARAVRLVGALQDVTARRGLEAELRQRNELMTSILENLPCGLSVFNERLELVAHNPQYRDLLGFPDELFAEATLHFESFIRFNAHRGEYGPGDVEPLVQQIVDRARQPAVAHQFERLRPTGVPLEIRGSPLPGGGFVTTYTDITERQAAQAEIERSGALLRGAIDAIDEAFVLYDPEDRLVFCNDKYRQIYPSMAHLMVPGATFESIIRPGAESGQYQEAVGRVEEWIAERMVAHRSGNTTLVQKLNTGRTLRIVERRMADGHIVGFRIDISEQAKAVEAAQQASHAKSQFVANMSHEIRTPMNAILGMLALLRRTELTPRQADYASKTEGAARSLLGLLNDILDFSKVEAGKLTLEARPFRIERLLGDLSVILSSNTGGKDLEVLFDIDAAVPAVVVGDAMRLQQVLINLGGNAVKFTTRGEVVVGIALRGRSAHAVTLEFSVRDTGIGISPENQARIFEGFTQAEASTTRRFGGTGLGVAISQRLTALMGGDLQLDSALGKGTRFHFSIELGMADEAALEDDFDQPASPVSLRRVLIVDDNPTAREVMQRTARSLGWNVDSVDCGEAALERVHAADVPGYDAVFVDWRMPGLDGWQTLARLRQRFPAGQGPKLLMVTASGRDTLSQRSQDDQDLLDGFLVKPTTAAMLARALAEAEGWQSPAPATEAAHAGAGRLMGLRLLVAEDNLNNQQVARELLEDEGAVVTIAENGREAVDAVATASPAFDLVLMDLQMPVMDGLEAARCIREDLSQHRLPIVAMTANALASDREACLAAGMNDHVGKPFDLSHLIRVIRALVGRDTAPEAVAAPSEASGAALPPHWTAAAQDAGVDLGAAVARLGGKAEVYQRMLRGSMPDFTAAPGQLQSALSAGDLDTAARLLHTLKGVAATLGARGLADAAANGERAVVALPAGSAAWVEVTRPVIAALESAPAALERLLQAFSADAPTGLQMDGSAAPLAAPDAAAMRARLQHLAGLLRESDMQAMDEILGLQRDFGGTLGEPLHALDAAISSLDFEAATQCCVELLERVGS